MENLDMIDIKNRIKKIDNIRMFITAELRGSQAKTGKIVDERYFILGLEHIESFYLLKDLFFDEKDLILKQERYNESPYELYESMVVTKNNRKISLSFVGKDSLAEYLKNIPSYSIVYDKDKLLFANKSKLKPEEGHKEVDSKTFNENAVSFFMNLIEVAASLSRKDLFTANFQYDRVKSEALDLIKLYVYYKYEDKITIGKYGQDLTNHLEEEYLDMLKESFHTANIDDFWSSVFNLASMYRKIGLEISRTNELEYPKKEDVETLNYLRFLYDNFGRNLWKKS